MKPYNPETAERLFSCHGLDRTIAILKGQDARTNDDLARWHAIGGEMLTPHAERLARAVSMVEAGVDAQTAAMAAAVDLESLRSAVRDRDRKR